ncbi:MAG TPA: glycosyltransferase family 2 protein [Humidesulfovibrio sp.]|uniref:glycosyltransferase family 2 protein n=1 Tax=Humidesulfovibrio sp. TaxID=2910988 RepID=UPI002C170973|nr:glycosyltransferase family 2 protein [Humidesulfovibrio sp.]HWR04152.1 glycosyltransferase family 2 protein [Humidesulfovibrio sp.]
MINGKRIVLVMPAFNAALTVAKTYAEIPLNVVDEVVLVDDASRDDTVAAAQALGIRTVQHKNNRGYGGNQKTCYDTALSLDADVVIMLHPDYQYTPRLVEAMVSPIAWGVFDCMLGSRILSNGALIGGMPLYKYISNRVLTLVQNLLVGHKLSEYHTGYRAYSRQVLEAIPYNANSDNFIFDNQLLSQIIFAGFRVGELTCPTRYADDSSSISFRNSVRYGLGVLGTSLAFALHRTGLRKSPLFSPLEATRQASARSAKGYGA